MKAVEAAIASRQWNKAIQILEVVGDGPSTAPYYERIAEHYSNIGEYTLAER
jgi:intraflagellar transport protein 172